MPNISPVAGLSLIIHITVNVVVFLYQKTIEFLDIPKNNRVSKMFEKLNNKEGDSLMRHLLSYTIVMFMVIYMSGSVVSTVLIFTNKNGSPSTPKNTALAQETIKTEKLTSEEMFLIEELTSKSYISVVDFLNDLGVLNTSFENRAKIAKDLEILDGEEYKGTNNQNIIIVSELQRRLKLYAENNN